MKIKAYKNYGVLQSEKKAIYTVSAPNSTAVTYDEIEIELPDGFAISENAYGGTLIETPDHKTYLADEIIASHSGEPELRWYDGEQHQIRCSYKNS